VHPHTRPKEGTMSKAKDFTIKKGKEKPAPAKLADNAVLMRNGKLIREAFHAGKKTVEIEGREFTLKKLVRTPLVKTTANPDGVRVKETWIVVRPVEGQLPIAQIEAVAMGNSRGDLL
jgi:hypothetical protein